LSSVISNPRERMRFIRFAIVGILGAIVDFGVMNLLRNYLSFTLVVAGTISFVIAIINNFLWNRYWTYPDSRSKPIFQQLIQFSIVSVSGLIIRIPILKFLEPIIISFFKWFPNQLTQSSPETLGANVTLAVAIIIVMFWNFFVNRYWTYNDVK
jgi:putative flippase GtrA